MTPYYEKAGIRLFHGDCREVLPALPRCAALVTDPPYGVNLVAKTGADSQEEASTKYRDVPFEISSLIREAIPSALEKCNRGIVFTGQAMIYAYPTPAAIGCVWIPNGAGRCSWGFQCFQPIFYYGKDPWLATGKGSRPNSFKTTEGLKEHFDHPCPKPVEWMKWAIHRASLDGESVLDPFAGSGTTLAAAIQMGRPAIGIELEEKYCEIAAKRLDRELAQGDLFIKRASP